MAHLYIVRGVPGSGKSTFALDLMGDHMVHFETDMWCWVDGQYQFDPKLAGHRHAMCQAAVKQALDNGRDVIVSNTFTRISEMQPYFDMGYPFTVVTVEGNHGNLHNVPPEVVQAMRDRWETYNP